MKNGGDNSNRARLVYSSESGRVCPDCSRPVSECRCNSAHLDQPPASGQRKLVAKLRMEKKGRAGKTVTVVAGLPREVAFLRELCQALKRACGTGGAVADDTIELQGDLRDRVRDYLLSKGFVVKG